MRFGPQPLDQALGATTAHSVTANGRVIRKGTILGETELTTLRAAGIADVVVAKLDPGDVGEDEAAARLALRLGGAGIHIEDAFTGRVNLYAETAGVLLVDRARIDRLNAVDEAVTFATLEAFAPVETGRMVGTVKIIPFAVPGPVLEAAEAAIAAPLISIAPYRLKRVGLIQTLVSGTLDKVLDKTRRVTEARLAPMGATIMAERRVPHRADALAPEIAALKRAGAELILVFGASAIADRRDVIPAAIEAASGRVLHFGMPVDPGNLLLVGDIGKTPVLGAPGCARSPKENGFDWILARLVAGVEVRRTDIMGLGVGGLLMEIATRPQPRAEKPKVTARPKIAGLVLAAGRSTRMGGPNKLLEGLAGKPIVRHAVEALLDAGLAPVTVVTGHMADDVETVLEDLPVHFKRNPAYADGLSTSLRAGVAGLPDDVDGVLVALGDMPKVSADLARRLVEAFDPVTGRLIVLPTVEGKRGNPVLWARRFFGDLQGVQGDVGARHLLGANAEAIVEVPVDGDGPLLDVDTPEALAQARALV